MENNLPLHVEFSSIYTMNGQMIDNSGAIIDKS
jgi:hypothetical protein